MRFYYSVGSRYSYLASTQVGKLEREMGCQVLWRPLYSVDLYELCSASPFEGEPVSGQYDWDYRRYDAECWAEYYGVSYKEPRGVVEFDPRLLARACAAADALSTMRSYSESMFKAIFAEGLPEIGEGECLQRAEVVGLSKDAFARDLASPGPERRLAEAAEEAHSAGAFGVPSFVVDHRMFWGKDRLVLVRHFLKK
ncbi:MAG: DsbA family protein [Rubrobacter sp.]|nr:DsbA family protein [Rubrobacter sp.]